MPRKSDTTDKEDQSRESQKDTPLIEEVELEEMTDNQEKEEETLETWTINCTKKSLKRQNKSLPSHLNKLLLKFLKNKKNPKNPKNWPWLSTIKAKVLISTPSEVKRKLKLRVKLTLNGLRKKSWLFLKLNKTRENKKMLSKTFFNTTTPKLNLTSETQKSSVSEPSQLKNQENKNTQDTTMERNSKERKLNQRLLLRKKTSHLCDL